MSARLECLQGDIANQPDIDVVVNAANAQLRTGGGVAGALHRAAGPELERACRPLAPIAPGQAVITEAFALPNRHVIHCLGPVYGRDRPEAELLADCYRNALELAEQHGLASIAFPALPYRPAPSAIPSKRPPGSPLPRCARRYLAAPASNGCASYCSMPAAPSSSKTPWRAYKRPKTRKSSDARRERREVGRRRNAATGVD